MEKLYMMQSQQRAVSNSNKRKEEKKLTLMTGSVEADLNKEEAEHAGSLITADRQIFILKFCERHQLKHASVYSLVFSLSYLKVCAKFVGRMITNSLMEQKLSKSASQPTQHG